MAIAHRFGIVAIHGVLPIDKATVDIWISRSASSRVQDDNARLSYLPNSNIGRVCPIDSQM